MSGSGAPLSLYNSVLHSNVRRYVIRNITNVIMNCTFEILGISLMSAAGLVVWYMVKYKKIYIVGRDVNASVIMASNKIY